MPYTLRAQITMSLIEISHAYTWKKLVKVCRLSEWPMAKNKIPRDYVAS
jgi:hypothetical protein